MTLKFAESTTVPVLGGIPFLKNLDPKGQIYYNFKHVEIDSDSTMINNSAIREQTSFKITKRFNLNE